MLYIELYVLHYAFIYKRDWTIQIVITHIVFNIFNIFNTINNNIKVRDSLFI